jgi:hypothetical protein
MKKLREIKIESTPRSQRQSGQKRLKAVVFFVGVVLFNVFASAFAKADGVVTSDFVFQLSNSVFAAPEFDFSSYLKGNQTISLPDTTVAAEVPVQMSGAQAQLSWELSTPSTALALGKDYPLSSKSLSLSLMIEHLAVDAVVDQKVGDVTIHAHVLGKCEKVPLSLPTGGTLSAHVKTGVDSSGLPTLTVEKVQAGWPPGAWSIGAFSCSLGGESFRQKIVSGLTTFLQQPTAGLNEQLRQIFAGKLSSLEASIRSGLTQTRVLSTGVNGFSVTLRPQSIAGWNADNFQIRGNVEFRFNNPQMALAQVVSSVGGVPASGVQGYGLFFPEGLLKALNDVAYRSGFYFSRKTSADFPSFQSLLANPLFEFFIWPQLSMYSSQDPFYFDISALSTSAGSGPQLGALADNGDGTIGMPVTGGVSVLVWAPEYSKMQFIKMIRFSAPISALGRLSFLPTEDGGTQVQLGFQQTEMQLGAEWESSYRPYLFNPNIALDTIQGELVSSLEQSGIQLKIPPIQLTSQTALSGRSVRRSGQASGQASGGWLIVELGAAARSTTVTKSWRR